MEAALPSRLATGELARVAVTSVLRALGFAQSPDADRIAVAYRSDRALLLDGDKPDVWSPYSRFWRARDGWLRTHGNYPHHAEALRRGLDLAADAGANAVRDALSRATVHASVDSISAAGGLAVAVQPEDPRRDAVLRSRPLVDTRRTGDAPPGPRRLALSTPEAPLRGIRVLDLTRVIAGPVCTRTLALLGAEVLRIDPPHLAEPEWQHLDTGHGKRSALLDARSPAFAGLLAEADVVVLGYRPCALDRLGLSPARLAEQHPSLIIAQLSAWGLEQPNRAGFDSLVQAESGIAMIESRDGEHPGALPAQALDHSAGYLLAASICEALIRCESEGGAWHLSTSLRRVAAELLGMPRREHLQPEKTIDSMAHSQRFEVAGRALITAAPTIPGFSYAPPRRWGGDRPQWRSPRTDRA